MKEAKSKYYLSRIVNKTGIAGLLGKWFGTGLKPKKWVFILGCYNSGTTLLYSILHNHHDIITLPDEGTALTDQLPTPENLNCPRNFALCRDALEAEFQKVAEEKRADIIKKHWSVWCNQEKHTDKIFVEKSISNLLRIEFFERYFQPAHFIFISRNGYAVSEGVCRKTKEKMQSIGKTPYTLQECALQWKVSQEIIQKNLHRENALHITYEELTEQSQKTMKKITDFLALSPIDESLFEKRWNVHEKHMKIENLNNSSFKKLTEQDIKDIESVAGKELADFDYLNKWHIEN